MSGTAPVWPDGSCDPDPEAQAHRCLEIIVKALGEAGATVVVRDLNGASLGTAIVTTAGSYAVTLSAPQVDGQVLAVTQAPAVAASPPVSVGSCPSDNQPR